MQNPALWIVLGLAVLLAAYLVYRHFKRRFDTGKYVIKEEDKLHVTLESTDFGRVAAVILEGLGGRENVTELSVDGTRLKAGILQYDAVDEKKIRSSGVGGVLRPSKTAVHIIVGENAEPVRAALQDLIA